MLSKTELDWELGLDCFALRHYLCELEPSFLIFVNFKRVIIYKWKNLRKFNIEFVIISKILTQSTELIILLLFLIGTNF